MSDVMHPVSPEALVAWIHDEWDRARTIFGIPPDGFFFGTNGTIARRFGHALETLVGPAAGPHTQMAQNLITGYLVGARFFELKTVQVLDRLELDKPCIDAEDEGYNIEWSQELSLKQSTDNYLSAWIVMHYLKGALGLSSNPESGFIFNMSVGYDLNGIQSEPVDAFLETLKDATRADAFQRTLAALRRHLSESGPLLAGAGMPESTNGLDASLCRLDEIPGQVADSVTLSTMHGCPPEEIEAIATYLMRDKGLHTLIKLNPTLLGYQEVVGMLRELGYTGVALDEASFSQDLRFVDAVPMITRLRHLAQTLGLHFGVKLSNTLGVVNTKARLAGQAMYLSGRALLPLTLRTAARLARALNGDLDISYCGGATALNVTDLLGAGLAPVTAVTDLLKPGGYLRLREMAEVSRHLVTDQSDPSRLDLDRLDHLADQAMDPDGPYHKARRGTPSLKLSSRLPTFDCVIAPCTAACPIHQDVPGYIRRVQQHEFDAALETILDHNPLPHITGSICDHACMAHCTRWDYDRPIEIRKIKWEAAQRGLARHLAAWAPPAAVAPGAAKVAVVGAGPAGLSAAFFLARSGLDVTVFDRKRKPGGLVSHVIPNFRLPHAAVEKDVAFFSRLGVHFALETTPKFSTASLQKSGFKYVYLAVGASLARQLPLETDAPDRVVDAIDFLEAFNAGAPPHLGSHVVVVGGGNSAMDGARAAKRCPGVQQVSLVYRRTQAEMPADREEFDAARADGIAFLELLQPSRFNVGQLVCQRMELGPIGSDGRRTVTPIAAEMFPLAADTVISAIGERVDSSLLIDNEIAVNQRGVPECDPRTGETSVPNVFIGGDARRGPATVVQAIADGMNVARAILEREGVAFPPPKRSEPSDDATLDALRRHGRCFPADAPAELDQECQRCLACDVVCNKCVDVCPNRANVAIPTRGSEWKDAYQILHLDRLCNQCGNCATFCPHQGHPYTDKFTVFSTPSDFRSSPHDGCVVTARNGPGLVLQIRCGAVECRLELDAHGRATAAPKKLDPRAIALLEQVWRIAPYALV